MACNIYIAPTFIVLIVVSGVEDVCDIRYMAAPVI